MLFHHLDISVIRHQVKYYRQPLFIHNSKNLLEIICSLKAYYKPQIESYQVLSYCMKVQIFHALSGDFLGFTLEISLHPKEK
jgi:hypothetical protein